MGLGGRNRQEINPHSDRNNVGDWQHGKGRADRVIRFIQGLKITSGMKAENGPVPFKLEPWQKKIIRSLYGSRPIRQCLITIPRKNGKTQLAAALALCHLCGPEARPRGQVVSAAADRNQAGLVWREMKAMIEADPVLKTKVTIKLYNKTLEDADTGSTYEALSCDARKAHGLSLTFAVCDELAQWKGRELYDNLVTATGAHADSLMVVISTMSPDPNHIMSELVRYGEQVRDGDIEDPTFLPVIYRAPQDADPWDEKTWFDCNPALGRFRSLDEFRNMAARAKRLPAQEPAFRLLYLNQPIDAASRFLNRVDWEACKSSELELLTGRRCYLGLDLSSTTDLTALVAFLPDMGDLRAWFWMPADNLEEAERRDHVPYQLWARQGFIETTPGRAIDKGFVVRRLAEIASEFKVMGCAYDRWGINDLKRIMSDEGVKLEMVEWGQGWKDSAPALDAIETLVLQRKLRHDGHPVMTWCVANAVTLTNPAGGRKLAKDRSTGRIDGIVAAAMACGLAARTQPKWPSVYAKRGVFSLEF